jgi:hypothetical protein
MDAETTLYTPSTGPSKLQVSTELQKTYNFNSHATNADLAGDLKIQKRICTKVLTKSYFLASKFLYYLNKTNNCIFGNTAIRANK